jgi:nucleotide-binding universal stress UspA family protein
VYKHLLVATDGSELATKALMHGASLAKALGSTLTVLAVTDPWSVLEMAQKAQEKKADPIGSYEKHATEWARAILAKAASDVEAAGGRCQTIHIQDKHPSQGILDTARELGCDAIVMSTHGRRGIRRMVLGSQAGDVIANATVPVIIVK